MSKSISLRSSEFAILSQARLALQEAETLPDIDALVDRAEVVRVAARASGLSTTAQNDWTRYKVDCQRVGSRMIRKLRAEGKLAEQGGDRKSKSEPMTLILPDLLGKWAKQKANTWEALEAIPEAELDGAFEKANQQEKAISESALIKIGRAEQTTKKRRQRSRQAPQLPDGMDLRVGDCRSTLNDVADNSVALVLTDPPYGDDAEPLYEWLADWSSRVLVPGGSLICYTGQSRLDRDIRILGSKLRYWWLLVMMHDRSQRLPGKFVIAEFKPVLWYVKGKRRGKSLVTDVLSSERDKSIHPWAQGTGGVPVIIEHLTEPGELILDPFAGTGTWGHIAAKMGRRWIGSDVVSGGDTKVIAS